MCETVMVAVPLLIAYTVNQTLLFTVKSPHPNTGSLTSAVAPKVVEAIVLFAHKGVAFEQLSCPLEHILTRRATVNA